MMTICRSFKPYNQFKQSKQDFTLLLLASIFISSLASAPAQAAHFSSDTTFNSTNTNEAVSIDGDFTSSSQKPDDDTPWSWDFNYTYDKTIDASQSPAFLEETTETSGGVSWLGDNGLGTDLELVWSTTPQENLQSGGFNLTLSYKRKYGGDTPPKPAETKRTTPEENLDESPEPQKPAEEPPPAYKPRLKIKLNAGKRGYLQNFESSTVKIGNITKNAPISGSNIIEQAPLGIAFDWRPWECWKFKFGYTYFFYNRPVSEFMAWFSSKKNVNHGISANLSNSASGFSLWSVPLTVGIDFGSHWNLELGETFGLSALDLSSSSASKIILEYDISKSTSLSLGAVYVSSSTANDLEGLAGFAFDF